MIIHFILKTDVELRYNIGCRLRLCSLTLQYYDIDVHYVILCKVECKSIFPQSPALSYVIRWRQSWKFVEQNKTNVKDYFLSITSCFGNYGVVPEKKELIK